ncbi:conserved hypothetical protein [Methanococcus vannielii SB]|uniref:Uncharacterized protein n=1 Tax=Methanococcus vannielii (strain ATCC 35089 / DSM 1224 / JCM 13029 / OCM 148 / SB) TaxID=406327 RepID=A6USR5_METVS|nr:hypothetical protein [Methanococcus vannielii]ABR55537.1 conserved hypothetical protein [Methanococcus vannielii SB]
MEIEEFLEILKTLSENNYELTDHFVQRLKERNFKFDELYNILKTKKCKGIINQNFDTFKLYYEYDLKKDIILVISYRFNKFYFISPIPQETKRRTKHE